YGQFLNEIGRSPHHSCLLLLSWEQPTEIAILETENSHCKTLHLKGLDGSSTTELLTNRKLKDRERWIELIQRYSGNPLWLNIISATISDLFNGSVSKFLSYSSLFLGDIESLLDEHYLRLSETEKLVMIGLANQPGITEVCPNIENLSDSDYLKAVQSLKKRSLLEIEIENSNSILRLNPAIQEYFKNKNHH
ncbi:AAA family ATPase, partial [Phormidium pseudopriestleyi FRX01]|nr:AAA family ATPase [Phormidium pseudopriestleyi FRX01]